VDNEYLKDLACRNLSIFLVKYVKKDPKFYREREYGK
jgi:hypothetical protein